MGSYSSQGADFGAILNSAEVRSAVESVAGHVASRARAIAPVDDGDYKASIHVEVRTHGGAKGDRPEALVVASAGHSAAVEFGNHRSRGQHVLARALAETVGQ